MWRLVLPDGRSVPLRELPATLGRDDAASVRVRHPSIAPLHARLRAAANGHLAIEAVGEARVLAGGHPTRAATLADGDTLVLGELSFVVRREAPAAPAAPAGGELTLRVPTAAAPSAPAASAPAQQAEPRLRRRGRTLQYSKVEEREGLLHADLAQLSSGRRALVWLAVLVLAGVLATGIALLFGLFR
jgi:hypothetical protein